MNKDDIKRFPKIIFIFLKLVVTAILIIWILRKLDITYFRNTIDSINYWYILAAFLIHTLAFTLFTIRWWILLKLTIPQCTLSSILSAYYLGLFWNNFLPTAIGGDVVRILKLRQNGFRTNDLILSSLADRIIGLISIVILGITAFVANSTMHLPGKEFTILLTLLVIVFIMGSLIILSTRSLNFIANSFRKSNHARLLKPIILVTDSIKRYVKDKRTLLHILFYSFSAQFLIIICYMMLSYALNITVPFYVYFSVIPVVFLASSIPISIGGLGVRETVLINLLGLFEVDTQAAIGLSILYFSMLIALTLPGSIFIFDLKKTQKIE